jgi:hypothetical protein
MENSLTENKIRIAHIILVHQFPEQLKKLIDALSHPQYHFYIHVDKKTNEKPFQEILTGQANISFIKKRKDVIWGGFSLIEAVIEGMKEILADGRFSHINLISGADYPLTSPQELLTFLEEHPNKEFFELYPIETEWQEAIPRYTKYHFPDFKFKGKYLLEKIANFLLPKRKMPDNMIPVGRLVWFTITAELTKYFIDSLEQRKHLIPFFRLTWGTDEVIFPTLAYNSPFKDRIVNRSLRYVKFFEGHAHPKTLDISDINVLYLEKYYFARKFHPTESQELIFKIDTIIKEKDEPKIINNIN